MFQTVPVIFCTGVVGSNVNRTSKLLATVFSLAVSLLAVRVVSPCRWTCSLVSEKDVSTPRTAMVASSAIPGQVQVSTYGNPYAKFSRWGTSARAAGIATAREAAAAAAAMIVMMSWLRPRMRYLQSEGDGGLGAWTPRP